MLQAKIYIIYALLYKIILEYKYSESDVYACV